MMLGVLSLFWLFRGLLGSQQGLDWFCFFHGADRFVFLQVQREKGS